MGLPHLLFRQLSENSLGGTVFVKSGISDTAVDESIMLDARTSEEGLLPVCHDD